MKKEFFDKFVEMNKAKSTEDLTKEIQILSNIVSADKAFANQCFAGDSVAKINAIFSTAEALEKKFSYKAAAELEDAIKEAKSSWNFMMSELEVINDPQRYSKEEKKFNKELQTEGNK